MLVQSACESRASMHESAWTLLGVLLAAGVILMVAVLFWIFNGGFSKYYHLDSAVGHKVIEAWLRES